MGSWGIGRGAPWNRFVGLAVVLTAWLGAPALASGGASAQAASGSPTAPFQVRSASLTQDGRVLSWQVQLKAPFSLPAMKREGRLLCLLIESPARGSLRGEVCAKPGHGQRFRKLTYRPMRGGRLGSIRIIQAQISKPSPSELVARFLPAEVGRGYWRVRWQVMTTVAGPHCSGTSTSPAGCATLYPAHPRLRRLHTPRLVGCVPGGPSLVFSGQSNRHELALTFDDGPWNDPPSIDFVRLLARYHVPATFFEIGDQISQFDPTGSIQRRMLADGDIIGDHTWTHPDMTQLSASAQRSELQLTIDAIRRDTGFRTCLWRPPYEAFDSEVDSVARSMGLLTINYDVDTQDWREPGAATIYQRAVSGAHNGAIILQHFGGGPRYETLDALPGEIKTLRHEGYRFVTVAQMLGLRLIYK